MPDMRAVRRQLLGLLRRINRFRSQAGFSRLAPSCLSLRRTPVKVFVEPMDHAKGEETAA